MLPTTPPPSYSSFQFDSTVDNSQSTSSVKNSTDASEDEGSFAIDSARSPPIHLRSRDEIRGIDGDAASEHSSRPDVESNRVFVSSRGEGMDGISRVYYNLLLINVNCTLQWSCDASPVKNWRREKQQCE